jgi:hypothetical protein
MNFLRKLWMAFGLVIQAACASGNLAFPVDENGPLPPISAEEWCEAKRQLANFRSDAPPSGMVGGLLFDGTANDVRAAAGGKLFVSLRIERKLFGKDLQPSDTLTLITPPADAGGVAFQTGRRYRVFAVPLRGNLYTWAATGSFDLDQPVDCPK